MFSIDHLPTNQLINVISMLSKSKRAKFSILKVFFLVIRSGVVTFRANALRSVSLGSISLARHTKRL